MRRALVFCLVAGCGARAELPAVDTGLAGVRLREVHPGLVLPSSEIDLVGEGFADPSRALARVHLVGSFQPTGGAAQAIDLALPAQFVDEQHLTALADGGLFAALPAPAGHLDATVTVLFDSPIDRATHASSSVDIAVEVAESLAPHLTKAASGPMHVNDALELDGDGFLLATSEGATHALVSGCFVPTSAATGTACTKIDNVDLTARPSKAWDRTRLEFPFSPAIAGIQPGASPARCASRTAWRAAR